MSPGISVIICCYNSVGRIEPTLQHLYTQKGLPPTEWEVILVDNASTDNTASVATAIWDSFPGKKPKFKVVTEPTPGLSSARKKGIEDSSFEYVVFCDDDNWLEESYLVNGLKIMFSDPNIGVLGGTGIPVFEHTEPPYFWVNQFPGLAVGEQSPIEGDITDERGVSYGAGMILNRRAFLELVENYNFQFQVSDRIGEVLMSSGDHEICLALRKLGYRIFYSRTLQFKHFIPAHRTTIEYYKKLYFGFGVAYALLRVYAVQKDQVNSLVNDYRYFCIRAMKIILFTRIKLLMEGYYFSKNKYKFVETLHLLYSNIGMLKTFLRIKNSYKMQLSSQPLFNLGSYKNNS